MFDEFGFPRGPDYDATAPKLFTFVYCSRAADGVDDAEVDRLIDAAQRFHGRRVDLVHIFPGNLAGISG
jgi:hypothetical protein